MELNILFMLFMMFYLCNIPWTIALGNITLEIQSNIAEFPAKNICTTNICRRSAERILQNMDRHVDPCDDFYKFACSGFRNHTTIPAGKTRIVNSFRVIEDKVKNQLREILEEESPAKELNAFRRTKNLYKSCMNTSAIKEKSLTHLQDILKQLGGWPVLERDEWNETNFNWIETIYKLNDLGFSTSFFMTLTTTENPKNSSQQVLTLDCAVMHSWKNFKKIINFSKHFRKLAASLGAGNVTQVDSESTNVTDFLQTLGNIPKPSKPIEMTLASLMHQVPTIPWKKYLRRMLPASIVIEDSEVILVRDPAFFSQFETNVRTVPKRVVANYMMYEALNEIKNFLRDDVFDHRNRAIQNKSNKSDINEHKNRWKVCINVISRHLPLTLDAMYVRKYFSEDTKTSVTKMAADVKKQFRIILQNADWLDNATQKNALEKIDSMKSHIGYSSELKIDDNNKLKEYFDGLVLNESNYSGNYLNLSLFLRTSRFSKLRSPLNAIKYLAYSSKATKIVALYLLKENAIAIPAAALQDYFFDNNRPEYLNYGAIGFTIGHEITHGFSNKGAKYGKDGNLDDWWTPVNWQRFMLRAQCLIGQYENYTVEEENKWHLDGSRTLDENIADNGGVKIAYLAYKEWTKNSNKSEPTLPDLPYNSNQMFWITAANQFCSVYKKKWLEYSKWEDKHSLDDFRIIGSISNRPEFAKDFECPVGSKMNAEIKCSVW